MSAPLADLEIVHGLPYTSIEVAYRGKLLHVPQVVIDTGSASSCLAVDKLREIGIAPEPDDQLYTVSGVGGSELVFLRTLDYIRLGPYCLHNFNTDVGGMDYGFPINGILGMDFLLRGGAILDFLRLAMRLQPEHVNT